MASILFVANVPMAFAAVQGTCLSTDTTKIRLYENGVGDFSDGNDQLWKCASDADLTNDPHQPAGNCHAPGIGGSNWNDCISSYVSFVDPGTAWCFYRHANYDTWFDHRGSDTGQQNLTQGDVLSSVRLIAIQPGVCNF